MNPELAKRLAEPETDAELFARWRRVKGLLAVEAARQARARAVKTKMKAAQRSGNLRFVLGTIESRMVLRHLPIPLE